VEHTHIEHPSFLDLPGGRQAYLYQTANEREPRPLLHSIYVQVAGESTPHLVLKASSVNPYPAYSPTGHIVYADGFGDASAIWAIPLPLATLRPGKPFMIAQHGASPTVSRSGTLVYGDLPTAKWQLKWVDRTGAKLSLIGEPAQMNLPSLSPDGRQLAVALNEGEFDLWIYDLERGTRSRFGHTRGVSGSSAWSPSGDALTFTAMRDGNPDLFIKRVDGDETPRLLVSSPLAEINPQWSRDGRFLLYMTAGPQVKTQVVYREKMQDGKLSDAKIFTKGDANELYPQFSPDGHYVAYESDESGAQEIYVRDFPKAERKWRVSVSGGSFPHWSANGKELFYKDQGKLYSVAVTLAPVFSAGEPHVLFEQQGTASGFDVSADGKRFIVGERPEGEPPVSLHVVHNWFAEFRGTKAP
jgi:dipeptidyl aminopeptidase/acylaminoacyl peptidase